VTRKLNTKQQLDANRRGRDFKKDDRRKNPEKYAEYGRLARRRHPERYLWFAARKRARTRELEFTIQETDIVIPEVCPILGIPLAIGRGRIQDSSPSLDRVDNSKGYISGNIQVISAKANVMKNNATPYELLRFARWIRETYGT
jgi:hypothetical protein